MARGMRRSSGFTLVEMMISIAVVIILLMIAVPSFIAARERATLGAAGEQVLGLWNQARFESAKRNGLVKFGVNINGSAFCIGVATTTTASDSTPCDCFNPAANTNQCNVAIFPSSQADWKGVTVVGTPTLGANTAVAVVEPRRTGLSEAGDAGAITFLGPGDDHDYRLNLRVDQMGRAVLCQSSAAGDTLPAYTERRCSP
jgi:type IV fimbrial biogenesis protein FimT